MTLHGYFTDIYSRKHGQAFTLARNIYKANVLFARAVCRNLFSMIIFIIKAQTLQYLLCPPWTYDTHWCYVHPQLIQTKYLKRNFTDKVSAENYFC